jgi:hypothetical protein
MINSEIFSRQTSEKKIHLVSMSTLLNLLNLVPEYHTFHPIFFKNVRGCLDPFILKELEFT